MAFANSALQARFDSTENFLVAFWNPSLYLELETVDRLGLDLPTVERALAEAILKLPGFAFAMTRTDLLTGKVTDDPLVRKVQRAFHPKRSGNVLIVQDPFWYLYPNPEQFSAMHGSPYTYDTHVPIMFAGPGVGHRVVHRRVGPEDIASTITTYLGVKPPSGSTGDTLYEILNGAAGVK
jgi:hypothetical protein